MGESNETGLSNEELVERLASLCLEDSRIKAEIVAYLAEVDQRRLYLDHASPSMFDFCTRQLRMSRNTAFLRIAAARLVRRHPCLLPAVRCGDLHLSTLILLKHHLTAANADELLAAVRGKSVTQVEELLAARAPKPDIATRLVPLEPQTALPSMPGPAAQARKKPAGRIAPLSPDRFALHVTVSREIRDKLEHVTELMRHRNPNGDVEVILDCALDELLTKLKKERLGHADRPRAAGVTDDGSISRGARREVFERDGEQCTYEAPNGDRCPAKGFLELDHIEARALGGAGTPPNLRVLCKPHNRLHAEKVYGRAHMEQAIAVRQSSVVARNECAFQVTVIDTPDAAISPAETKGTLPALPSGIDSGRRECLDNKLCEEDRARALEGLVRLGFKQNEATRALDTVVGRRERAQTELALPDVLRDAIGLLT